VIKNKVGSLCLSSEVLVKSDGEPEGLAIDPCKGALLDDMRPNTPACVPETGKTGLKMGHLMW
jgi:hypothetical protein